jgi:CheY-like chemotaxis protein
MREMADLRLKNCSVLVVDDSAASRTLLATTLYDIGIGVVNTVPHGAAAIDYLERSVLSSMSGPTPPVDVVISEWDMEPVGGMMLMQWLRRSLSTPDRFLRAVIMSGALDMEKVEQARNVGVNAVFTKPFTINRLRKHLLSVVEGNPPFFKTPDYFGPDRRRRNTEAILSERRQVEHPVREVFGAGDDIEVGCFDLPNALAQILDGTPRMNLDFSQRNAAHELLAGYCEDYTDWVRRDIGVLRLAFRTANENAELRQRNFAIMHTIVQRLEREAEHMDYPLISALARTLKNALRSDVRLWHDTAEIFDTAIKGLETVMKQRISGHGGALGRALNESLANMDKKIFHLTSVHARRVM